MNIQLDIAVEWLKLREPSEPVGIDFVLKAHGGDRRSDKDQPNNVRLKAYGNFLDRVRPMRAASAATPSPSSRNSTATPSSPSSCTCSPNA
jgi:hypothetical protein